MRKYNTNLNNMITLRVKEELIKTKSFGSQKYDADNFTMHRKFRYYSEISIYSKISTYSENFAMHRKFRYIAKFLYVAKFQHIVKISIWLQKFRYHCEIFAMIAKLPLSSYLLPGSSSLHYASSACYFFIPSLMKLPSNHTNSAYIRSISMPSLK